MKNLKKSQAETLEAVHTDILTNEKGITLMALIVTIIVLLILAGISISMLAGDNGIIKKATEAADVTETATIKEQIQLAVLDALTEGLGKIESTESLDNSLQNYVEKEYNLTGDPENGWTITVPEKEITYQVDGNGKLVEEEYEEIIDNSKSLVLGLVDDLGTRSTIYLYGNSDQITSGNITITMPDDSTQTITAVSDNTEISDEANYATYTVTKNGTYTFSVTNGVSTTETKIKVSNIETFTPIEEIATEELSANAYSYKGAVVPKGYYVDTNTEVDTGLVITDEIDSEGYATGNEWVWVPVNSTVGNNDYYIEESGTFYGATSVTYNKYSKLYSFSQPRTRDEYGTFLYPNGNYSTGTLGKPSADSGYVEPAYVYDNYSLINKRRTTEKFTNATDLVIQYRDDYENMIKSVDTYKGFYIGRYEMTEGGEKPGVVLTNANWYTYYNECMKFDNEYVTSGMMYGTLWDAMMQWLLKSGYSVGYGEKTSGYGNYLDEEVTIKGEGTTIVIKQSGQGKKFQTGQTSYTKSNNIYDLSGNFAENTQEKTESASSRSSRGGAYYLGENTLTFSASRNVQVPTLKSLYTSSRSHFYIRP